ncbi:MAG: hypothetical protein JNJ60_12695 [Rhodocyclaceae bacterium]|nr:hypothetical protein [Rhodocyclaceae bacterium]
MERLRSVLERAAQCREAGAIGELLRSEGLYSSHLSKWRQQANSQGRRAKAGRPRRPEGVAALQSELASLQAENAKLARRLEQAEAIIEVQKKVSELLGILPPKPSIGRNE